LSAKTKPPVEREVKFAQVDLEQVRQRLLELEAERVGPGSLEENWLLDRSDDLGRKGSILRIRSQEGRGAAVTFKGPAKFEGNTKVRPELEMNIADAAVALELFTGLGYQVVRRYQKVREEWRLGAETICLDHTPIGDFIEFEGERAEAVARRCGFDPEQALRKSYLMLYADYVQSHPEAPHDMVFVETKPAG
jgi:predicted adenylyl cyclase CyaB